MNEPGARRNGGLHKTPTKTHAIRLLAAASLLLLAAAATLSAAPLVVTSVTASPASPQVASTSITWTANTTGGIAPLQYRFWNYNVATGIYTMVRDWSATRTYTWATALTDIGTFRIEVWVKNNGSVAPYDAAGNASDFILKTPVPTITGLTANVQFPKVFGSAITWTTATSGGKTPLQFRYYRYKVATSTWTMVRDFSATSTFAWTPTVADVGQYQIAVWVKYAGSTTTSFDASQTTAPFDISGPPPRITSFGTTTVFPTPAGKPITWTVVATGGLSPLQYRFYRQISGVWTVVQDYSTSNTFTWTPLATDVGTFSLQVWVRNNNSSLQYDAFAGPLTFTILAPLPLSISSVSVAPALPREQGSIIQWTAASAGGIAPIQYQFWRFDTTSGLWVMLQDYSSNNVVSWTTTAADVGQHAINVWARSTGSVAPFDTTFQTANFNITGPTDDIVRFLEQATWGPTDAEIERVRQMGMSAWIDDQFTQPPTGYPTFAPITDNPAANCTGNCQRDNYSLYPMQKQFFLNALYGNDQLRQRVAFAIHSLAVTSGLDLSLPSWSQPYHQAIWNNVFGNYWQLLYDVSLVPGMGEYLNLNTSTLNNPNENYAREIMQLFSLGTGLLNLDGSYQRLGDGSIIPTYDQFTVTEFARALTCWHFQTNIGPGITNYRDPMICTTANHDLGSKQLLSGFTTAPGASGAQDLFDVINNIFDHPNVGPYFARHLIRQLVTSNPSPEYIARIATVFNNNGSGMRGDIKAVVKALLLDPEARASENSRRDPAYGHMKSPPLLITQLLRAMNVKSANGLGLSDGYLAPQSLNMGEDVLQPPTVFSYFPADYLLPGTATGAPEFGVYNSVTALKRADFVSTMVFSNIPVSAPNAPNGTSIDLSGLTALAGNPNALLKELDRILLHDTMSSQMQTSILGAVNAISASNPLLRAQTALYLVATSSQYQVER